MDRETAKDAIAIVLIAVAGCVDAIAYLHFSQVFASTSGNTTTSAIDLARGEWGRVAAPATAMGGFVLGAFAGTLIAAAAKGRRTPAVVAFTTLGVGLALVLPAPSGGFAWALLSLGVAMGAQNAAMDKVGGLSVNVAFVTSTVFKIGQGLADAVLGRPDPFAWAFFLAMWVGLILGAVAGAGLHAHWGLSALAASLAALIAIAAASAALAARGEMDGARGPS